MLRLRAILLVALAATATATTGAAAVASKSPLKLALQRADMPANIEAPILGPAGPHAMPQDALRFIGTGLKGAEYSYTWATGGKVNVPGLGATEEEWIVSGEVFVAPGVDAAKTLFKNGKKAQIGYFSDFPSTGIAQLSLPKEGDEQFALTGPDAGGPQAMVFVRKGSVVWELRVGHSPAKWHVTKSQVVALLKTYAAKQKSRVGPG